jgi:hypothetical protein
MRKPAPSLPPPAQRVLDITAAYWKLGRYARPKIVTTAVIPVPHKERIKK